MPPVLVDRGDFLKGASRTVRDHRVPYNKVRSISNFALPDSRARRRAGYKATSTDVIVGQMLAKHSPSIIDRKVSATSGDTKSDIYRTPLSYGLIRYNSNLRLTTLASWTIDFYAVLGEHESLVVSPYERRTKKTTGSPTWDLQLRRPGVYLLDWCLLSNYHKFDFGTPAAPTGEIVLTADHTGAGNQFFDSFPLPVLAVSFTKTQLKADMGLIEKTGGNLGRYWPNAVQLTYNFSGGAYIPGTGYNIAIRYIIDTRTVDLLVNGVVQASYVVPSSSQYGFIGEYDLINGETYETGQARDIVLLNECTVRGSYNSTCKIQKTMHGNQVFYQDFSTNLTAPNVPWCCSPPRGTAIRDLRFWNIWLSTGEIIGNLKKSLTTANGLIGNWVLDSGVGINFDTVNNHVCSSHHTYPSYVSHPNLLNDIGIHFADGQHLILPLNDGDRFYVEDIATAVQNCFGYDSRGNGTNESWAKIQSRHEFTAQIQIITPRSWQPELNRATTASPFNTRSLLSSNIVSQESRRSMSGANAFNNCGLYRLVDGGNIPFEGSAGAKTFVLNHYGSAATGEEEFLRAYDMTLFSIEAGSQDTASTGEAKTWKVPLARGLISPDGKVVLEVLLSGGAAGASPRFYRLVTGTSLTNNTAYTLTFVKRTTFNSSSLTSPAGIILEIYIGTPSTAPVSPSITFTREILLAQAIPGGGHVVGNPHQVNMTLPVYIATTGEKFEVTITGVGGTLGPIINGTWVATKTATGFTIPVNTTALADGGVPGTVDFNPSLRSSFIKAGEDYDITIGASNVRDSWDRGVTGPNATVYTTGEGPWSISQHFMNPYQDQPGNFMMGFFRLWSRALDIADIQLFNNIAIPDKRIDINLIINVEISSITGTQIKNNTRYSSVLFMGYKSWGNPQAYQFKHISDPTLTFKNIYDPICPGGFSMEDCLGYIAIKNIEGQTGYTTNKLSSCTALVQFQTTITRQFALLGMFGENILIDRNLSGTFTQLYGEYNGLLNEFSAGTRWRGITTADRTLLVSNGGTPRTYDGKSLTSMGFKRWSGGYLTVRQTALLSGVGLTDGFYNVRVVYSSETRAIQHISESAIVQITGGPKAIAVFLLQAHPDPRVSSYTIYRTRTQTSEALARVAPLFPVSTFNSTNGFRTVQRFEDDDNNLIPFPLDLDVTPFPECALIEIVNDTVYLAGDLLIPDAVYFSDLSNPERIDTVANKLILESGGDRIVAIIGLFNTLFVFKTNSIWRIEMLNGVHQVEKVAYIGAVSEDSIHVITNPDTGRTSIFFWSQHGPYIFDGTAPEYIGFDIEDKNDPGVISSEFTWLDPTSVQVLHDPRNRELICLYKIKDPSGIIFPRRSEAVVYNYRFGSWYSYTGVLSAVTLSTVFSGESFTGFGTPIIPSISIGPGPFTPKLVYTAYIGGTNGKLYEWGKIEEDGLPDTSVGPFTIACYGSNIITLNNTTLTVGAYKHLYISVIRVASGKVFTVPIEDNDAVNVTLSTEFGTFPFTPEEGDIVYLCFPPSSVEFPWDTMDHMFIEKEVLELIMWSEKNFYLNIARDWDENDLAYKWRLLQTKKGQRTRLDLKLELEALKLSMYSFDKGSAIDSFGYKVNYRQGAIKQQ